MEVSTRIHKMERKSFAQASGARLKALNKRGRSMNLPSPLTDWFSSIISSVVFGLLLIISRQTSPYQLSYLGFIQQPQVPHLRLSSTPYPPKTPPIPNKKPPSHPNNSNNPTFQTSKPPNSKSHLPQNFPLPTPKHPKTFKKTLYFVQSTYPTI